MQSPRIQILHSPQTPWEVFQQIHPHSQVAFFLDSVEYQGPSQRYSYICADPFLEVAVSGGRIRVSGERQAICPATELFPLLRELFRTYRVKKDPQIPFFTGGALGFWSYEMAQYCDRIKFRSKPETWAPQLFLAFFRQVMVYDHRFKVYYLIDTQPSRKSRSSAYHQAILHLRPQKKTSGGLSFDHFNPRMSRSKFETMVKKAKSYIRSGDIYQANLSQRFSFDFSGSSLKLYDALRSINPSPFSSFIKIRDLEIISSSPERLVYKKGRYCETKPIAGTRPYRKGMNAQKVARELTGNDKERAEHIMLVDLERNDLGRVCDFRSVKVKSLMATETYSHVMHIVSTISGQLANRYDVFDLIKAVFPGGTITGCPKIRCMEIIDELEPLARGLYTGSLGYIDFSGDADLNIIIRTLVLKKGKGYLQTGAGIVYDSDPKKEYEETLHKGEALIEALAQASAS